MTITHLDGNCFRDLALSGAYDVINSQEQLNKINVFPVPDGDTGSNMAAAFESIARDLLKANDSSLHIIAKRTAEAALNGSRGNSGAILTQFFYGLQEKIGERNHIATNDFAEIVLFAAQSARNAISNPIEGTIITVMRDWATWVSNNEHRFQDFTSLFSESLHAARESLLSTPQKLAILSDNHVVDAGAQGFFNFLQGATEYLKTQKVPSFQFQEVDINNRITENEVETVVLDTHHQDVHLTPHATHGGDLNHQFCTECIIHGQNLDLAAIKQKLGNWGDSMVVVGGGHRVKIHIHTNAPNKVFREANQFGEVLETKADDMWAQYRTNIGWYLNKQIALITDSACNMPQEFFVKHNIIVIPLQVIINNQPYLDRVNINLSKFLALLVDEKNKVSTSQASPADIKTSLNKALSQSPTAIGIFLSEKLSGSYQAICNVAQRFEDEELYIYNSKNVSGGIGLIVAEAAKAIQLGKPLSSIKKLIADSIYNTHTFVSFTSLKYAIRGGRVSRSSGFIASLLRILPVLRLDKEGKPEKMGLAFGRNHSRKRIVNAALKCAKRYKFVEMIVSHADALADAQKIAAMLKKKFPYNTIEVVETTPLLAAHTGPGTIAVSVLGKDYP